MDSERRQRGWALVGVGDMPQILSECQVILWYKDLLLHVVNYCFSLPLLHFY